MGTTIGKHCIINTNCSIDHDCKVSDFVHIAPELQYVEEFLLENPILVGAGATILPNIMIGEKRNYWCKGSGK